MMTTTLTDLEKIRRLPWLLAGDSLNTAFFLLTFTGPVFLLFLNQLGMVEAQIGVLLSLVPFANIVAPFIAPTVARFGYKRVYVTFWGIRKLVISLLLFTPAIVAYFGADYAFAWVAGTICVFALCRSTAETGGYPWRKEAVPDSIRGKFSALNNMSGTVVGILITVYASYVIGAGVGLNRFMVVIATGIVLGLISVWAYTHVPGGDPVPTSSTDSTHLQGMKQALHDRDFLLFLGALGLATVGGTSVISFIPLFMKQEVGLSDGNVVLLNIGTYGGALLSSYLWGWTADRYGSKPVMLSSLSFMLLLPVAWFFIPRHSHVSLPLAMTIAFGAGIATLAWQISWVRYLFVNATPADQKSPYLAVYYAWFGFISGFGPLLAGQVLALSGHLRSQFWLLTLDPYAPLFAMSFTLLVAGIIAISRLGSGDATPFRRFAGMFLRGNPIRAMESLIQYNFSGNEMTRVATTERMGDAQNPLSIHELIEAMSDPSFNVRYEAVHSIGRMPPEPELIEALLTLLDGPESELSSVAARSLGKLGDKRAILPLRKALFSGYPLLEANSARALAALGDVDSIPHFLAKLSNEPNDSLRVAYASALGIVRAEEAIDQLFTLLHRTQSETLRGEVGLALARIAGDERYYMQHWRSVRANPTTATAQAVLALQKRLNTPETGTLADECAQSFARGDSAQGAHQLKATLNRVIRKVEEPALTHILHACANSLAEFGDTRIEYILLALHTLDIALRQPTLSPAHRLNEVTES